MLRLIQFLFAGRWLAPRIRSIKYAFIVLARIVPDQIQLYADEDIDRSASGSFTLKVILVERVTAGPDVYRPSVAEIPNQSASFSRRDIAALRRAP
jgi:hypothetical protein